MSRPARTAKVRAIPFMGGTWLRAREPEYSTMRYSGAESASKDLVAAAAVGSGSDNVSWGRRCASRRLLSVVTAFPLFGTVLGVPTIALAVGLPGPIATLVPRPEPTVVPFSCFVAYQGERRYHRGDDKKVSAELVGRASACAGTTRAEAKASGQLNGCFAGRCRNTANNALARAVFEAYSGGGSRLFVDVAGKTLKTWPLSAEGSKKFGPYIQEVSIGGGRMDIIPGVISATAEARVGAGFDAGATWKIQPLPPRADLNAQARTFANGSGEVAVSLVDAKVIRVGSVGLRAEMDLFNPTVVLEANTSYTRGLEARAKVEWTKWKLYLKAFARALCAEGHCAWRKQKTLLASHGPSTGKTLFGTSF